MRNLAVFVNRNWAWSSWFTILLLLKGRERYTCAKNYCFWRLTHWQIWLDGCKTLSLQTAISS